MKTSNSQTAAPAGSGRLLPLVRFWHRAWALYHSLENHAACKRGDLSAALTHAEKELKHIAKTPLRRKPNDQRQATASTKP